MKTKAQISFAVTAKLISAFVFATWIVQFLYFLNSKFPASGHLLCLYSSHCVGQFRSHIVGFPWKVQIFTECKNVEMCMNQSASYPSLISHFDVRLTSIHVTSHRHQSDVILTSCACWDAAVATSQWAHDITSFCRCDVIHQNDVILTSYRRHVISTSMQRHDFALTLI